MVDQRRSVTKLTPPHKDLIAMQAVTHRHRRGARTGRVALGHDPRFLRPRPAPTPRYPRDHLHPTEAVTLRCIITVQTRHRAPPPGRPDHHPAVAARKVGWALRLPMICETFTGGF